MSLALPALRRSEVTTKRGLASPLVHSALATTRRLRLQLVRVLHMKLLKRRTGRPVRRLLAAASSSSLAILPTSRSLPASPIRADMVLLAPGHQVVARKSGVGTQ